MSTFLTLATASGLLVAEVFITPGMSVMTILKQMMTRIENARAAQSSRSVGESMTSRNTTIWLVC